MNRILITGGSGYVGNYILKTSALRYSNLEHLAMSRRGTLRQGDDITSRLSNVKAVQGDCLKPDTYPVELADCDAIIHAVGTLIEGKTYETSYNGMNRDSCIKIAEKFNQYAGEKGVRKPFVLISSEKPPPFLSAYQTSKLEAEDYIVNECPHLDPYILRPGFVVDKADRSWSIPLSYVVDLLGNVNSGLV